MRSGERVERLGYYESELLSSGALEFRANRLSYVGELGYELYVRSQDAQKLWQRLWLAGEPLSIRAAGFHAITACRKEKGYRHWGDDIHDHITPLLAGLGFAISKDKVGYLGQPTIDAQRGIQRKRLVSLAIKGADPPFMLNDEPIFRNGTAVGLTTSAAWSHRVGKSLAMAELTHEGGITAAWLREGNFEVEVALQRYPVMVQSGAFYDPDNHRMK